MAAIAQMMPVVDGSMVRVEAQVRESFMGINETGFSMAKIINSSISCRFLGSPPYIFKPGMPFSASVSKQSSNNYILIILLLFHACL